MINPNISKFVIVEVSENLETATYKGFTLPLLLRGDRTVKPGRRRLWLKFSILNDRFYLTDRP